MSESTYVLAHGDVNLTYGGLFIADQGHSWAEVIEVTDLDSTVGTTNLVLVEQGQVTLPYRLHNAREALRSAWSGCGGPGNGCRLSDLDRAAARLVAFSALWQYGHRDIERSWTLATDREFDEWAGPNIWRVSRECVPLRGQGRRSERWRRPVQVNGEKGLRRWLAGEFGIAL